MTKNDISKNCFYLNNLLNIPIKGKIPLYFDKQALDSYIKTEVKPNTKYFSSLSEKLNFLVKQDYIEEQLLNLYSEKFLNNLYEYLKKQEFKFHSFMGAYKFYTQYALKTNDNKQFLENFIDRVFFNSLYLGNGDEHLAKMIAEELINQRYQPATPTFLNAGKKDEENLYPAF